MEVKEFKEKFNELFSTQLKYSKPAEKIFDLSFGTNELNDNILYMMIIEPIVDSKMPNKVTHKSNLFSFSKQYIEDESNLGMFDIILNNLKHTNEKLGELEMPVFINKKASNAN